MAGTRPKPKTDHADPATAAGVSRAPVSLVLMVFSAGSIPVEQEHGDTELHAGNHLAFPASRQYAYVDVGATRAGFVRVAE